MPMLNNGEHWACGMLLATGFVMMVSAPAVLALQAIFWLRDGAWTPLNTRRLWRALDGVEPAFTWQGVQQIAVSVLDQPLSVTLFAAGLLTVTVAVIWGRPDPSG